MMTELTLEKFEEAAEIVKKVTLPTNLIYSDFFSRQCGTVPELVQEHLHHCMCGMCDLHCFCTDGGLCDLLHAFPGT